jgi:hypothetical protein
VLGDLFYNLGVAVGELGSRLPGKPGAGFDVSRVWGGDEDEASGAAGHPGGLVAGAAGAWVLARALRPKPVSWTRVVIAGVAATLLAELAARVFADTRPDHDGDVGHDPETLLRRYGSGIATAAGYAALLYPRLPGSPLVRGLTYGALEVAAAERGGLIRMASEVPGLRFPLQGLAVPDEGDPGPFSHLAFGLGLGLFYRHDPPAEDEEEEEEAEAEEE